MFPLYRASPSTLDLIDPFPRRIESGEIRVVREARVLY
jgi:hypothetical protein